VVTHDVESSTAEVIGQHFMTFKMQQNATVEDALWELSLVEPSSTIQ
jgi:hypothetical protein